MIDLDNQTALHFNLDALENIASMLSSKEVELLIVDDEMMKSLNFEHRGKDVTTDVLSFPLETLSVETLFIETPFAEKSDFNMYLGLPLGSIVISSSYVIHNAKELGHSVQDELSLLFIHGMLHLLGFDHESDDGAMRKEEEKLIEKFALPQSLIIRTGE